VRCNGTNLKRGVVGPQRFKESAIHGTYWGDDRHVSTHLMEMVLMMMHLQAWCVHQITGGL